MLKYLLIHLCKLCIRVDELKILVAFRVLQGGGGY